MSLTYKDPENNTLIYALALVALVGLLVAIACGSSGCASVGASPDAAVQVMVEEAGVRPLAGECGPAVEFSAPPVRASLPGTGLRATHYSRMVVEQQCDEDKPSLVEPDAAQESAGQGDAVAAEAEAISKEGDEPDNDDEVK